MARCKYCGRSAGLLHNFHLDCRNHHQYAISTIPKFFTKFFDSQLTAERFRQLLVAATETSFVRPEELKDLSIAGLTDMITSVLEQRLPTPVDEQRLAEVMRVFDIGPADARELETLTAKIDILRQLEESKIPDLVIVPDPLPFPLRRGESIIWIFNRVACLRRRAADEVASDESGKKLPFDTNTYFGLGSFKSVLPRDRLHEEAAGDLIVTSRNLYMLSPAGWRRIPVARITAFFAYKDGIHVKCESADERSRSFALNDAWLASNMIIRLIRLVHRQ